MKTLGVSMIVKNESECIEACLESIKDADEIVIVDTGSEDNTVEICKRYTDNVFTDYKWNDDFSEARNVSLSRCTADWVLIIDADEQLLEPIEKIKKLLNSGFMHKHMGMVFNVQAGMERVNSCRIVKNDKSIIWVGAVHNQLMIRGEKNNETLRGKCYTTHLAINSDYSPAHKKDIDRSLRILTKQLELYPDDARYMYYIAREYITRRMRTEDKEEIAELHKKIIYWLEKCEAIAFYEDWTNELSDAFYCLALAYIETNRWHDAVVAALKSFMVLPSYKAPATFLSAAMMSMPRGNKYPAAADYWKKIADKCTNAGVAQIREPKKQ